MHWMANDKAQLRTQLSASFSWGVQNLSKKTSANQKKTKTKKKKKNLKNETHEPECWHICWRRRAILITFSTGHSCATPWHDTLIWHCGKTILLDNIAQHSCETLLLDTLWSDTLSRHSCEDTLVWHSDLTRFPDTPVRRSYFTLVWGTLTWHSCNIL